MHNLCASFVNLFWAPALNIVFTLFFVDIRMVASGTCDLHYVQLSSWIWNWKLQLPPFPPALFLKKQP